MTNNDILRRLRYILDYNDPKLIKIFKLADMTVEVNDLKPWFKKDDEDGYKSLSDEMMATFLNGLIIEKRGKREGPQPVAEKKLNNNIILTKLRIAFNLKAEEILDILQLADFRLSKHELSAFSRKPGHKHYRECKDQILRNFLQGLQLKFNPS